MCFKTIKDYLYSKLGQNKSTNQPVELLIKLSVPSMSPRIAKVIAKYPFNCKEEISAYLDVLNWVKLNRLDKFGEIICENHQNYRKLLAKLKEEFGFEREILNVLIPKLNNERSGLIPICKEQTALILEKLKPFKDKYPKKQIIEATELAFYLNNAVKNNSIKYAIKKSIFGPIYSFFTRKREEQLTELEIIINIPEIPKKVLNQILKYPLKEKITLVCDLSCKDLIKDKQIKEIILKNYTCVSELLKQLKKAIVKELDKEDLRKEMLKKLLAK